MYRQMLLFLIVLLGAAILFSAVGILPFDPWRILAQAVFLIFVCWGLNSLATRLAKTKANFESPLITALILSLILGPAGIGEGWLFLTAAALAAMFSKYLLVFNQSHIFNPAAFGALAAALILGEPASWWVGNQILLPLVVIGGLIIAKKVRRFQLVGSFLAVYLGLSALGGRAVIETLLLTSPLLFFCFVMLIEPLTSPQRTSRRIYFGVLVGAILFAVQKFFPFFPSPLEAALLAGNIFVRVVNPNFRQTFTLAKKEQLAPGIIGFWFMPFRPFSFMPGQFLEYTLPHRRPDARGARRYFTIASAPTEKQILLVTKFSERGSSFKQALKNMETTGEIIASKVDGDFVLPAGTSDKMVFIAGGIGITPFRGMIKHLLAAGQTRNIILLYGAKTELDFVFRDVFEQARQRFGMKVVYTLDAISQELIRREVPDFQKRLFYVSGPEPMVENTEKLLAGMGVSANRVKRDYFPGYES